MGLGTWRQMAQFYDTTGERTQTEVREFLRETEPIEYSLEEDLLDLQTKVKVVY